MLKIGHSVTRPGRIHGDEPVTITVPEELETVPGARDNTADVDFYSMEYPLNSPQYENTGDSEWEHTVWPSDVAEEMNTHFRQNKPFIVAAQYSAEIEPDVEPVPGRDVTQEIKAKARELGFGEVGITRFDRRYVYKQTRDWVRFPHAICLAYEQDYGPTQTAPSMEAEGQHFGVYRKMASAALVLDNYIRSLGYHAQDHGGMHNTAAYIPMFVEAGLGQLGANGQLLSPHFGSRARLMLITTDAEVKYDQPIDYGINAFCTICQVCVNRCPGRALMREKVWWRGVQKHKLTYKRCRPVLGRYSGCAVCIKTCPIQRYGMKSVMDHYVATGQVLGKGTHLLEGYTLGDKGYFGPGELPHFDTQFFRCPIHTRSEDVAFQELKERIKAGELPDDHEGDKVLREFKGRVEKYLARDPLALIDS